MERFKINLRDYFTHYFRTIAFLFLFLIILSFFLSIGSEDYLRSVVSKVARTIPFVAIGNIIIAYFYSLIIKNKS